MNIGICFGGYCPLHRGHLDLIMESKKKNDLTYDYAFPQRRCKADWKKDFGHNVTIEDYVKSAYAALKRKNK